MSGSKQSNKIYKCECGDIAHYLLTFTIDDTCQNCISDPYTVDVYLCELRCLEFDYLKGFTLHCYDYIDNSLNDIKAYYYRRARCNCQITFIYEVYATGTQIKPLVFKPFYEDIELFIKNKLVKAEGGKILKSDMIAKYNLFTSKNYKLKKTMFDYNLQSEPDASHYIGYNFV